MIRGNKIKCDNRVVANPTTWGYNLKLTTKQMPHGVLMFMGFPCGGVYED